MIKRIFTKLLFIILWHSETMYAVAALEKSRKRQVVAKLFVISFVENSCSFFICSHETQRGVAQTPIIHIKLLLQPKRRRRTGELIRYIVQYGKKGTSMNIFQRFHQSRNRL